MNMDDCYYQQFKFTGVKTNQTISSKDIKEEGICWYELKSNNDNIEEFKLSNPQFDNATVEVYLRKHDDDDDDDTDSSIFGKSLTKLYEFSDHKNETKYLYDLGNGDSHVIEVEKDDAVYILVIPNPRKTAHISFDIATVGEDVDDSGSGYIIWIIVVGVVFVIIIAGAIFIYCRCKRRNDFKISKPYAKSDEEESTMASSNYKKDFKIGLINRSDTYNTSKNKESVKYYQTGYDPQLTVSNDAPYDPGSFKARNSGKIN